MSLKERRYTGKRRGRSCIAIVCMIIACCIFTSCGNSAGKTDGATNANDATNAVTSEQETDTPVTLEYISELEKTMEYPVLDESGSSKDSSETSLPDNCYVSKKGMQVNELIVEDAIDLGIEWGFINFYFNELISAVPTEYEYTYKDRTYYFNKSSLETSDYMISRMSKEGIKVMAAVVSGYNEDLPELRYPGIDYNPGTQYYAFNVKTQEGIDMITAVMTFLLDRYKGEEYGFITDWVIGNEVNDNLQYNYIGACDGETYVAEYYEQFKMFYNIIKEHNKEANIYIPMEHRWNTANTTTDYGAKWFLEYFHECELKDQEMDWGLAWHPYPYPLGDSDTLDDGDEATTDTDGQPTYGGEVTMEYTSPLVSMKNIHVITDFLSENLLTKSGKMRSIVCSEVGYTSYSVLYGENQSKQAANIAYALTKAQMNPYIDAFIIRCQLDVSEGSPYFQFGLREDAEGKYLNKKLAFDVYKYLDTTKAEEYIKDCLPVLGIDSWSDVIEGYSSSVYENMTDYTDGKIYRLESDIDQQYVGVLGAYEDYSYDDMMYRCYFMDMSSEEVKQSLVGCSAAGFEIKKIAGDAQGALKVRIRIRSGRNILEAEGVIYPDDTERFILPVSDWEYIKDADSIELWLSDADTSLKYGAEYKVRGFFAEEDLISDESICKDITYKEPELKSVESLTYTDIDDLVYTGQHQRPGVQVSDGDRVLEEGTDYCLSYARDKDPGTALAVVQGIGEYTGTHVIEYEIMCEFGDVFDPIYYLEHNPDVREAYGDDPVMAQNHFIAHGMSEGRRASKEFDPMFYRENYPDLRECYGDDCLKYYLHYKNVGKAEGRVADRLLDSAVYNGVDYTPVYDAAYYAKAHFDLYESLDKNEWKLLRHFVEEGMALGERGSAEFDVKQYMKAHPELKKEFGKDKKKYYMYYLETGFANGDSGTPKEDPAWTADNPLKYRKWDLSCVYDPVYYVEHNPDAAQYADDPEALIRYFVMYGMKNGQRGSYEFDTKLYFARYCDIREAFGNLLGMGYYNYISDGKAAGR